MRKIVPTMFIMLLIFLSLFLSGYDLKPVSPLFKPLKTPQFSIYLNDTTVWMYLGDGKWVNLATQRHLQHKIDSIAALYRIPEAPADHKIYGRSDSTWVEITSSGGGIIKEIFNEIPTGLVNGINTEFVLDTIPVSNTERLFLNGIRQLKSTDYTIILSTINFSIAPETGDLVTVDYMKMLPKVGNYYFNITPIGDINGINRDFSVDYSIEPPTSRVYLNGIRQYLTTDYTVSGNIITFVTAPEINDIIIVDYINIP